MYVRSPYIKARMSLQPESTCNKIHLKAPTPKTGYGKITEIVTQSGDLNDMPLLMPLLAQLSYENRWFAWISPPLHLPRSLLLDAGIDLKKVILLYPDEHHSVLQLAKKALSAGTCHAVISWADEISEHEIKSLEQSAQQGSSNGILIRRRHH
ncbi:cell division inhibitor SulA [Neptunomonas antarctica]|uniref:SOS cell division inhibitor SulA n=1 Tax=Neptunomonas antarctica TaxID=619304 RepID=A0A1N7KAC7_9GAMM|nr:SulA-like leucine-rich domain-containing protein [Neptunomonas antarctica]SIS58450.1 SOS cell division inhibitor SulA [Neptunomonas antarctica]